MTVGAGWWCSTNHWTKPMLPLRTAAWRRERPSCKKGREGGPGGERTESNILNISMLPQKILQVPLTTYHISDIPAAFMLPQQEQDHVLTSCPCCCEQWSPVVLPDGEESTMSNGCRDHNKAGNKNANSRA